MTIFQPESWLNGNANRIIRDRGHTVRTLVTRIMSLPFFCILISYLIGRTHNLIGTHIFCYLGLFPRTFFPLSNKWGFPSLSFLLFLFLFGVESFWLEWPWMVCLPQPNMVSVLDSVFITLKGEWTRLNGFHIKLIDTPKSFGCGKKTLSFTLEIKLIWFVGWAFLANHDGIAHFFFFYLFN